MISKKHFIWITIFSTLISCEKDDNKDLDNFSSPTLSNQSGFIKNFIATRGSYQWLIGIKNDIDTTYYFDKNLGEKFKSNYLKIKLNAITTNDSTVIYKPLPNDLPTPDFKVRNIKIKNIQKK